MADVKWIKITTDIFSDEKILLLEQMPDADSLLVIWFKLLCMAGKENNYGVFLMRNRMPYTEEMLATIFRRPINTVRLALSTFEAYGMIDIEDDIICIPNWEKHQNIDGLEKIKEQNRIRKQKQRERQKQALLEDSHVTSRDSHATDKNRIDKNRKEKNIENYSEVPELDEAIKEFIKFRKNAKKPMTDNAVKLLINKLNKLTTNVSEQIEILNQSIMNGWTGIYELKQDIKKPVNIGYQQSDVDDMPFFT
jgi:predicted phage replisome organizer